MRGEDKRENGCKRDNNCFRQSTIDEGSIVIQSQLVSIDAIAYLFVCSSGKSRYVAKRGSLKDSASYCSRTF